MNRIIYIILLNLTALVQSHHLKNINNGKLLYSSGACPKSCYCNQIKPIQIISSLEVYCVGINFDSVINEGGFPSDSARLTIQNPINNLIPEDLFKNTTHIENVWIIGVDHRMRFYKSLPLIIYEY